MADDAIRFEDGAGYEKMMGTWSRIVGEVFLDWVAPPNGLRWVDVGCGNGAFTELLVNSCAPAAVQGYDPSEGQLSFARTRPASRLARFDNADAMALPAADASFDAAVMALVIFFVPDPVRGVAELVRVVRPGGIVCAYAWDMLEGGFPLEPLRQAMRDMGVPPKEPPSIQASRMENLRKLWTGAGIQEVQARQFTVERVFADFEEMWTIAQLGSSNAALIRQMAPPAVADLKERFRAAAPARADGSIACSARANGIKGIR